MDRIVNHELTLRSGLKAGGATIMWERVVLGVLSTIHELVPAGSRVLEVGYGDGLLTCYLAQEFGWQVVGLEVNREAQRVARQHARHYGLLDRLEFCCDDPQKIYRHQGQYDAVFIKTVLYNSQSLEEYGGWLDWILSVLKPGGIFINFETGRGNTLTRCYRRWRGRCYVNCCLYTHQIEALYDSRFEIVDRRYYGGWSQFLAPVPALYAIAARSEETLRPRHADNCFIAAVVGRRPG